MKFTDQYTAYLASAEWSAKRAAYWRRYGKRCQVCGSVDRLEVDHLDYARLGRELLTDLLGLCRTHHLQVTEARRAAHVRSGDGYRRVTEDLFGIKLPAHELKRVATPGEGRPKRTKRSRGKPRRGLDPERMASWKSKQIQIPISRREVVPETSRKTGADSDPEGFVPKHLRGARTVNGHLVVASPGWVRNGDIPITRG